ncbi:phenylalanine--tRNA ligase subunit beta [Blattabacterium cuenoti]|uniref:phenylalanine--tRNA ligase subunit beta n=1 Tax=Blattabacterium cuenoti TaxID=1653831 RepID=UPI00163C5369|nr:phenylalanine--tRNA ligase subunit beta [Blattabacterium cuenoti]
MKISYNWIKNYIYFDIDIEKICNTIADIGIPVKKIQKIYINKKIDYILYLEITPNRTDAMSHYGIARDLYIMLKYRGYNTHLLIPKISDEKEYKKYKSPYKIFVKENKKCIRYSGMFVEKIRISTSPDWLIYRLKSIGIKSINNIIDIVNFIMYELGIPIHVFDADKIKGKKILVKTYDKSSEDFQFNDNIIRTLDNNDLIITDENMNILSISGIINNTRYNINNKTNNIFFGSIFFDPLFIRKTRKKHIIETDYQYFLEKGIDPNLSSFALKRLIFLLKTIKIEKNKIKFYNIIDFYIKPNIPFIIKLYYKKIFQVIGKNISKKEIKKILFLLEIIVNSENEDFFLVTIPTYRTNIKREIDLIEEILRIYGIKNIKISNRIKISPIPNFFSKKENKIQKTIFNQLISYGFQEIISYPIKNRDKNSIILNSFFKREEIMIINPINKNNNLLRTSLLFGMIDCIINNYNNNRKSLKENMKFFEIGKIYYKKNNIFFEKTNLGISIMEVDEKKEKDIEYNNYFYLKGIIEQIFQRCGIINYTQKFSKHPLLDFGVSIFYNNKNLIELGKVKNSFLENKSIFYAEIDWEYLISIINNNKINCTSLIKYPISRRDLSILIDKTISFEELNKFIHNNKIDLIKNINIYDLYEGGDFSSLKKSYTISFLFENKNGTLTEKIINHSMEKIKFFLQKKFKAEMRKK